MKSCKPSDWNEVRKLIGMKSVYCSKDEVNRSLESLNETANVSTLVNFQILLMKPSSRPCLSTSLHYYQMTFILVIIVTKPFFSVTKHEILMKSTKLNLTKANDPILSWLLRRTPSCELIQ